MASIRKGIFITCLSILLGAFAAKAQTWSELFAQKKTQRRYLVEQLAALKVYSGYLKNGYDIGRSGLGFIRDATNGEFNLHDGFFDALKTVSPQIRKYPKVAQILLMQVQVAKVLGSLNDLPQLSVGNQLYVKQVSASVLESCTKDLEELLLIITSGKLEMQEDERMQRIDRLYDSMEQKWTISSSFFQQVKSLSHQKGQAIKEIGRIGGLYGN